MSSSFSQDRKYSEQYYRNYYSSSSLQCAVLTVWYSNTLGPVLQAAGARSLQSAHVAWLRHVTR